MRVIEKIDRLHAEYERVNGKPGIKRRPCHVDLDGLTRPEPRDRRFLDFVKRPKTMAWLVPAFIFASILFGFVAQKAFNAVMAVS